MESKKKALFLTSIVFKVLIFLILMSTYDVKNLVGVFWAYVVLNISIFFFAIKDNQKTRKSTISFSFYIDMLFSLFLTFIFFQRIKTIFYFYPMLTMIYYFGNVLLLNSSIIAMSIIIYSLLLLIQFMYTIKNNITVFNGCFYFIYMFLILLMIGSIVR